MSERIAGRTFGQWPRPISESVPNPRAAFASQAESGVVGPGRTGPSAGSSESEPSGALAPPLRRDERGAAADADREPSGAIAAARRAHAEPRADCCRRIRAGSHGIFLLGGKDRAVGVAAAALTCLDYGRRASP
ncbi:hypothetical protein PHYPSEUDO_006906 [Phytophthora pseudosyringae]|uniref:Uncharacterized protein n=1 Tax=Phytophthora pseudosyringae TaxID=221518 RepID=A0A8T1VMV7_9STRA|nr:hypothetical protein PHYPSEUDO_006906 [Phytophthora pseudosyringae]